jgi:hypothetical protein
VGRAEVKDCAVGGFCVARTTTREKLIRGVQN